MRTSELDYSLDPQLIAQHPVTPRDSSRLLVVDRSSGLCSHHVFRDLPRFLRPHDCLVINETRVMPYRLLGEKLGTGARIEVLLLERLANDHWVALANRARRLRPGVRIRFGEDLECQVERVLGAGRFELRFFYSGDFDALLERQGQVPLPPYVERPLGEEPGDRQHYQTVYARLPGSSAAPTAGLHFTPSLMNAVESVGARFARIVLHVGPDTFVPIKTDKVQDHSMHRERYEVSPEAACTINTCRQQGGRIIAVGTTSVRTLETVAASDGQVRAGFGFTRLFIQPGYQFQVVDALITNFHLPRTTLLALVAAFAGVPLWRHAYEQALEQRYRLLSFGDAMLIL